MLVGAGVYVGIGVAVAVGVRVAVGTGVSDGFGVGVGVLSGGTQQIVPASAHCSPFVVPPLVEHASWVMQVLGFWQETTDGVGVAVGGIVGVGVFVTFGIQVFVAEERGPSPHEFIGVTLHEYL